MTGASDWPSPLPPKPAASVPPGAGSPLLNPLLYSPLRKPRGQRRVAWLGLALVVAWLAITPFMSSVTELRQNAQLVTMILAVLGVNIATGYGGMISLGHGVFMAIGSFGTAYAVDDMALPWAIAIVAGAAFAGLCGALVGLPTLRIRGIHLALVTLGLAIAFQPLAKRFPAFTGGVSGRSVGAEVVAPSWLGTSRWATGVYRYLICIAVVALVLWLTHNLIQSRAGRAMRAVRDNDTAAAVYGVQLVTTRVATFSISAGIAGLAGALGVMLVPFTSQESYPAQESLLLYAMAVLGGLGTIWGAVAGVAIREAAATVGGALARLDGFGPLSELFDLFADERFLFGAALIALTFVFPRGLTGLLERPIVAKSNRCKNDTPT